ncbi:MAG TPA: dihydrofolate reductase [Candidatus Dormibacteraeota bacterium]|nr:dihydrofolate reductase [Candidatus Dormibacteraeota bacterium]
MIRLIVAVDRKLGLAKRGFQPWYIPDDEQYFAEKTKSYGGHVLIGKTTFQTFKHGSLTGRQNYVLTHSTDPIEGVTVVHDLNEFLEGFRDKDLWIVGGAKVFAEVMQAGKADELYITRIDADFGCDQFFPAYEQGFKLADRTEPQEQNGFTFTYARYTKKA